MYKNTASQKWVVFAFEDQGGTSPGEPKTGDAANITANLYLDGSATPNAVDDLNPTELGGGYYVFDITAAESNADCIVIAPASSTANINVIGVPGTVYTTTDVSGVEAKIDTIDGIVDNIILDTAEIGTAGAGLTAVPWNVAWDAEVQSECTDALNAYDPPTRAELTSDINSLNDPTAAAIADAVWDELQSGHVTAGSFGEIATEIASILGDTAELQTDWANGGRLDLILDATATAAALATVDSNVDAILADTGTDGVVLAADQAVNVTKLSGSAAAADNLEASALGIITGAAQTGTLTTTVATTNLTGYADDQLIGRTLVVTSGAADGEATDITDYANASGTLTFTALTTAMGNGDTFVIV